MAKIHSRKRGNSRSRKPIVVEKTKTLHSDEEIKEKVIELAKKGTRASEIGLIMRDQYGVGDLRAFLDDRLVTFLKKEKTAPEYPQDLIDLIRKAVKMRVHMKKNVTDNNNKVKLSHVESKIHRLVKYYKKEKVLTSDWKYQHDKANLLLK